MNNNYTISKLDYNSSDIKLVVSSRTEEKYRVTSCSREPDTISWIESFENDTIFFDVGANVGAYSLVAAAQNKNIQTISFEPAQINFQRLLQNIRINKFDHIITPVNFAVSDRSGVTTLEYHDGDGAYPIDEVGSSGHQVHSKVSYYGKDYTPLLQQNVIVTSLDDFCDMTKIYPTAIKIDVDGIEDKIIKGSAKTLNNEKLTSVLVEINKSNDEWIISHLKALGFIGTKHSRHNNWLFAR